MNKYPLVLSLVLTTAFAEGSEIEKYEKELGLPDYSFAGYHRSERLIPEVDGPVFDVSDYGAIADDGLCDRAAIQKTVDAAAAAGGGVVFFPSGKFILNDSSDTTQLKISSSNIVWRGAGAGEGGTTLFASEALSPPEPIKLWRSPYVISVSAPKQDSDGYRIVSNAEQGSDSVEIEGKHTLAAGDWVVLSLRDNDPEFVASELAGFQKLDPRWTSIIEKGVVVQERHQVKSVEGNRIVLTAPIMKAIDRGNPWSLETFHPISEIGFEAIRFEGNWHGGFVHHRSWLDDGGYSMLKFSTVVNSWIRDCEFTNLNRVSSIGGSAQISVLDTKITGTPGHNAICFMASSFCLMKNVEDQASQWHSLGVANPSIGNVLLNCYWNSDTCFESHSSQPRYTLIDSCAGGFMKGHGGGAAFNLPTHMEGLLLWNHLKTNEPLKGFRFEPLDELYWRVLQPIIVGMHGTPIQFAQGECVEVSGGVEVEGGSLFEFQLKRRLGR